MQLYKRRGHNIVVEAMKVDENSVDKIANWAQAQVIEEKDAVTGEPSEGLNVKTRDGNARASRGMYVVKTAENFYVVAEQKFESMYEAVIETVSRTEPTRADRRTTMTLVKDPFEGMTRVNEGPKP